MLAGSDAGIVCFLPEPNHVKSMPNKLFDYMAAGIPVVASNFPLWRKIVEENECGICVDPLDPGAIAEAVRSLRSAPQKSASMGRNGRRLVDSGYNWAREKERLLSVYRRVLDGGSA
jgi:glycosyltransferase involved in cell wall biosynthesis